MLPHITSKKLERGQCSRYQSFKGKLVFLALCIFSFVFCQLVRRENPTKSALKDNATSNSETAEQYKEELNRGFPSSAAQGILDMPAVKREWLPRVNRAILQKLENMERFLENDDLELFAHHSWLVSPQQSGRWPPTVSYMPEPKSTRATPDVGQVNICETEAHPRPCRFLLPLRISEQESKARIHIMQLLQLARALNRTLVLPNVGKSRIGACYRWNFETYYDAASLKGKGYDLVTLEAFRGWAERGHAHSQLFSIVPKAPTHLRYHNASTYRNQHIEAQIYVSQDMVLPGCLHTKFRNLRLQKWPVYISLLSKMNGNISESSSIGDSIIDALRHYEVAPDASTEPYKNFELHTSDSLVPRETSVVSIDWDLRYPIFPTVPSSPTLRYSPQLITLAEQLAPIGPYLVIHWRMETMDPDFLPDCAHALIDTLSNIFAEQTAGAQEIQTVWLASDYPRSISRSVQTATIAKSGTFRNFGKKHEEAIELLINAFQDDRELGSWRLTELQESVSLTPKGDDIDVLLQDNGALGILDKLISMKATIFVSGGKRCSRTRYVPENAPGAQIQSGIVLSLSKLSKQEGRCGQRGQHRWETLLTPSGEI